MKKIDDVKFVSTVPGVADMFPITPMSEYKTKWSVKARDDYLKLDKTKKNNHVMFCPGIFDLFKVGWYVSMWYDVYIKTKKDEPGFSWRVASPVSDITEKHMKIIDTHGDNITKFIPKRESRIENIVKINTPYHIIAPKDLKFLFLPMPYPDHYDWESASGLLEPALSSEVNVQLYWNVKDGEKFIKAGTPLCQIIPLTKEKINMTCREANEKEWNWINKRLYFNSFSFSATKNKVKELYNRYFND